MADKKIIEMWYKAGLKSLDYIPNDAEFAVFGAGRTVCQALQAFHDQGFKQTVVCGSEGTKNYAIDLGIVVAKPSVLTPGSYVYIDGADQIDPDRNLIKGGFKNTGNPGIEGCMYREKGLAYDSKQFIVIADDSKLVDRLGQDDYRLPVEVVPDMVGDIMHTFDVMALLSYVRKGPEGKDFLTENGNLILDVDFSEGYLPNLSNFEAGLEEDPSIYAIGLFAVRRPEVVIIAYQDRIEVM